LLWLIFRMAALGADIMVCTHPVVTTGRARLREVTSAGGSAVRGAAEIPFNMILAARP
jgi:hypothetical protein